MRRFLVLLVLTSFALLGAVPTGAGASTDGAAGGNFYHGGRSAAFSDYGPGSALEGTKSVGARDVVSPGHDYDLSSSFVTPRIPASLAGSQRTAFSNADSIYRSSELGAIRNAHASGIATEVRIGGTTVLYEPGMPASGMTLFGEDAFVLGPHAFVSEAELAQTLLHESHRLATSARPGSALVTSETQPTFDFAVQNYHALLGG